MNLHERLKNLEDRVRELEEQKDITPNYHVGDLFARVAKLEVAVGEFQEEADIEDVEEDSPPTDYYVVRCCRKNSGPLSQCSILYYTRELKVVWTHQIDGAFRYYETRLADVACDCVKVPEGYERPEVIGIAQ